MANDTGIDVAIVGGGIAGLTLALGLISRGVRVRIYERGRSFREIGAGIGFTPNSEWAMKVLDPRIHAAFKRVTVQNGTDWFMWVDGEEGGEVNGHSEGSSGDKLIHKMYLGERGFEGCHRADFLEELTKMMPEGMVEFSKNLESIVDNSDGGRVELKFKDGTSALADAVVGCDGIRSRVRQLILGEDKAMAYPSYTHKYAFRGLVPMEQSKAALGEDKTQTRHMYLGPDGHALTFPVAGGALLNVVAFTTDPAEWPHQDKFTAPASKADAVAAFAAFSPAVRTIIDLLPEQLDKWAVFDTYDHPAATFVKGRVCISGDAAHAAAPYHGAGAGLAIEDGAVLAYLLSNADAAARHGGDSDSGRAITRGEVIRVALDTYDAVRRERAHWLVQSSREVGEMYEWQRPDVGKDHDKCAREIEWRSRKIWDYNIDAMMSETADLYNKRLEVCV